MIQIARGCSEDGHQCIFNRALCDVFFCSCILHPQVSAIEQESIDIDQDTKDLLDALDFKDLAGVVVSAVPARV